MKTTIEIADDLLARAKREARRNKTTVRAIVDEALRMRLAGASARPAFKLKKHPFKGEGRQPGVSEQQWEQARDLIYRLG